MKKGEKVRLAIVEETVRQMSERGIAGTTFQKLADSLGLSQSAIFHHFKNKTSLFKGVVEYIVLNNHKRVENLFLPSDSAIICIKKHCMANIEWLVELPNEAKTILHLYHQSGINDNIAPVGQEIILTGRKRLVELVYRAQREGDISASVNPEMWGRILHEFIVGAIIQLISMYHVLDLEREVEDFSQRIDSLIKVLSIE